MSDFHSRFFHGMSMLPANWSVLYLAYNSFGGRGYYCDRHELTCDVALRSAGSPPVSCSPLCRVRGQPAMLRVHAFAVRLLRLLALRVARAALTMRVNEW